MTEFDIGRAQALVELTEKCKSHNIRIDKIFTRFNGFIVTFMGHKGDAALHDCTYGHDDYYWETYKFPWDEGDVTIHNTDDLISLLETL